MNDYKRKLAKYHHIISITGGCGGRAQHYIDDAYQELADVHIKLTDDEKNANPLPKKVICMNDGTDGMCTAASLTTIRITNQNNNHR